MKILCFIDQLESGGAQRQLVELAKGLKNEGNEVYFLTYHPNDFYDSILQKNEIPEFCIVEANYFKRLLKVRKFIRNGNYDVVLSFLEASNFMNIFSGLPFRKWKVIVGERSAKPQILKSFKLKFYRWWFFFADAVVSNSKTNLKLVRKVNPFLGKSKLHVIYNIVNIPEGLLQKESRVRTDSDIYKIVIGARHVKLKNLNGLIEAVHLSPIEIKKRLRIDWYGSQSSDESYKNGLKKIQDYGLENNFNFFEPTAMLLNKIQEADAVSLLSFYEGFPNLVCEGMRLGKPIICTPVSDLPEILKEKENAFFCWPENPMSISEALQKAMSSPLASRLKMGENNRQKAKKLFDNKNIVQQYLKLFK